MQKNKFAHEDIKAVCNTATKKLVALGLCVAVGVTGVPGHHNLTAEAQQNVPVGKAAKSFEERIKSLINDINSSVERVEQRFTPETIKRVLQLPETTRLAQVFSAWSYLVPSMRLEQVLTEDAEDSVNRLLALMPQQERELTELRLARLNQRNSDEALFAVLRDIALLVERPLYQISDWSGDVNSLIVIDEVEAEEAAMRAAEEKARREEEEVARCKEVARCAAEETVTRAREKVKKRGPRLYLDHNDADDLPFVLAALRKYADGQDNVRGGNRFNRALQALLEIERAEQRARFGANRTAEQRARLKDNWMKAEESFQRALLEDDLMDAAVDIDRFWRQELQRLAGEESLAKQYKDAKPEMKKVIDLIKTIKQTAEQIERNFGSRRRIQAAVQRLQLPEHIRNAFSVLLNLRESVLDHTLYEKTETSIDELLDVLPLQERRMILQRIDGMSREDIGTLIVVLERIAELVALPNSLSPAAFNSEFDAHVHRWQGTYADEDARRSKAEEIYARFNHAMNRIKSACSTSTNPDRCVKRYVAMSYYCQLFSDWGSQDVLHVLQDQALLDFATSASHLEDAERFVIHLEESALEAEELAERRARREAEEQARREAEERERREAEEEARRRPVVYSRRYSNGNIDGIIVTRANDVEIQCDASVTLPATGGNLKVTGDATIAAEGANRINAGESSTVYSTSSNLVTHDGTGAGMIDHGDITFTGSSEDRHRRNVTVHAANSVTVAPNAPMRTQNGTEFTMGATPQETAANILRALTPNSLQEILSKFGSPSGGK